jgi:hypothetical protein
MVPASAGLQSETSISESGSRRWVLPLRPAETNNAQSVDKAAAVRPWGRRGAGTADDGEGLSLLVARLEVILYANLMLDLGMSDLEVAGAIGSGWRLDWRTVNPPAPVPARR